MPMPLSRPTGFGATPLRRCRGGRPRLRHVCTLFLALTGWSGTVRADTCPDVLVVLDRSCSMLMPLPPARKMKYQAAADAIKAVTGEFADKLPFGLAAFPVRRSEGDRCAQGRVYVPTAPATAADIATTLAAIDPAASMNCGTPTGATLEALARDGALWSAGRRHTVVLVTDGIPICPGESVARAVKDIELLHDRGIDTFVVGFNAGSDAAGLDAMAEAGGQPQPPPAATRFYDASDEDKLTTALRSIIGAIGGGTVGGTCTAPGERPPAPDPAGPDAAADGQDPGGQHGAPEPLPGCACQMPNAGVRPLPPGALLAVATWLRARRHRRK